MGTRHLELDYCCKHLELDYCCRLGSDLRVRTVYFEVRSTNAKGLSIASVDQSPKRRVRRVLSQAGETRIKGLGG